MPVIMSSSSTLTPTSSCRLFASPPYFFFLVHLLYVSLTSNSVLSSPLSTTSTTHFFTSSSSSSSSLNPVTPRFRDVSVHAGLRDTRHHPLRRRIKYGGAAVADLDGDGLPDMICGHHTENRTDVYWNEGGGVFSRADWNQFMDLHGVSPVRRSSNAARMHFILSRGGSSGTLPKVPSVFSVGANRKISDVTDESGIRPTGRGRGRATQPIFLDRSAPNLGLGTVFMNARMSSTPSSQDDPDHNFIFSMTSENDNSAASFAHEQFAAGSSLGTDDNHHVSVTDADGDGFVELVTYHDLRLYTVGLRGARAFDRVNWAVLPRDSGWTDEEVWRGVQAVAELDYDNDGQWDLFIARTSAGNLKWRGRGGKGPGGARSSSDRLLRNVGGRYVDVSEAAGIPRGRAALSQGVTTGDFNNDGWIDILVIQYDAPDYLLLNNGDGTFSVRDAGIARDSSITRGDMATAVDVDEDGRLELVVSEGEWFDTDYAGYYKLFRDVTPAQLHEGSANFLLVRVRNAPSGTITSLHATATVTWKNGCSLQRRVGAPGTAVANSYIETLHFGIGDLSVVATVSVRWANGEIEQQTNVYANSIVTFGV